MMAPSIIFYEDDDGEQRLRVGTKSTFLLLRCASTEFGRIRKKKFLPRAKSIYTKRK